MPGVEAALRSRRWQTPRNRSWGAFWNGTAPPAREGEAPDAEDAIETDIKALARERISGISNAAPRDMEALEKAIQAGETGSEDDIDARLAAIRETASSALDKLSSAGRQRLTRQRRAAPKPVTMLAAAQLPRPAPLLSAPLPGTGGRYVLSFGEVMVLAGEGGAGHCARCGASEIARRAPYRIEAQRVRLGRGLRYASCSRSLTVTAEHAL